MPPAKLRGMSRAVVLTTLLLAGCSSESPPSTNNGSDAGAGDASADAVSGHVGTVRWKDDGVACSNAEVAAEPYSANGMRTGFGINVTDGARGRHITLNVVVDPALWKAGTYSCSTGANFGTVPVPSDGVLRTLASCEVVVTQVGAVGGENLKGTFSATLNGNDGSVKLITEGALDVPYLDL